MSYFNDLDSVSYFHVGQAWESPKNTLYKVESVIKNGKATLITIKSGRKIKRNWDDIIGWRLHRYGENTE